MTDQEQRRTQLEAELLGSILYQPKNYKRIRHKLRKDFFSTAFNRKVYAAIEACFEGGSEISYVNLAAAGHLTSEEVARLTSYNGTSADSVLLTTKLCEMQMESIIQQSKAIADADIDVFEKLQQLDAVVSECNRLAESQRTVDNWQSYESFLSWVGSNAKDGEPRIKTGFSILDSMFGGGLCYGDFSVVGGVPGAGKTSFLLQLALAALDQGIGVALLEGEMTREQILTRLTAIAQNVATSEIRSGRNFESVTHPFITRLYSQPFFLDECHDRTLAELRRKVEYFAVVRGCRLILVDYLQVFAHCSKGQNEYEAVSDVSRELRRMALKHKIHILAASSLNRLHVARGEKPGLQSLRSSGQLGHDASVAMFLIGEENDDVELLQRIREIELHVAKNRDGVRGKIRLDYHLNTQRMVEKVSGGESRRATLQESVQDVQVVENPDDIFEDSQNGDEGF